MQLDALEMEIEPIQVLTHYVILYWQDLHNLMGTQRLHRGNSQAFTV